MKKISLLFVLLCFAITTQAQNIYLLAPEKTGGKSFLETINERRSERSYVKKEMPLQTLSNLLWVANGFNRDDKRTAPTGSNKQEMELYVTINNTVYFYNAKQHVLEFVTIAELSDALGQPHINDNAAVTIIMVADITKSSIESARMSSGYISQNIYLFAASEDLGTVARGSFKRAELSEAINLNENQVITLVQPVGFLK